MKFVLPFLFSAAIAVPLDILPQATPAATRIHELAIVPTTAGQIGINPPPDDPVFVFTSGDVPGKVSWDRYAQEKCATGGDYNSFFSNYVDSNGKWTASNTDEITQVQITTKNSKPTTITITAPVAVVTGPSDALDVLLTPSLNQKLDAVIKSVPVCTKKRDASCGFMHMLEIFKNNNDAEIGKFKAAVENIQFMARENLEQIFKTMTTSVTQAQFITALGNGAGYAPILFGGWFIYHQGGEIPSRLKFKNPPKNNLPTTEAPPKEPEKCAKDAKGKDAPACPDCDGKNGICQSGEYKLCDCLTVGKPIVYSLSQDWLDQQTAAIKYAIAHMDDKPTVSCPTGDYDTSINVDKAFVNKMADKFCTNDFDTKKEHSFTLANKDISSEAYKKYQFDFWYSPGSTQDDTCLTCSNAIKAMTGKCQGYDSHYVAPFGNVTTTCGAKYGYNITIPNKTKDADIKCSSDDSSQALSVDSSLFESLHKKFCSQDLAKDGTADLKNSDVSSSANPDLSFHFESTLKRDCQPDCETIFSKITQKCQGQDSHSIQKSGSASFGCGASYSYRITEEDENPKKPSDKLGKVHCFGKSEFDYKAVDVSTQKRLIGNLWHNLIVDQYGNFAPSQTINSTSAPRGYQYKYDDGSVYSYRAEWIKGCEGPPQDALNPLHPGTAPNRPVMLSELYYIGGDNGGKGLYCPNNGGAGGWRNGGCVRYTFKPQWDDNLAKVYWGEKARS